MSRKMSAIPSITAYDFWRLLNASRRRVLTPITSLMFQNTCSIKSARRLSGMMSCVVSGATHTCAFSSAHTAERGIGKGTHIAQVLHVAHEIALGINYLIDRLLPSLLLIRHAINNFLGYC